MYLVNEELMQDIIGMFAACRYVIGAAYEGEAEKIDLDYFNVTLVHFKDKLHSIPFDGSRG